MKAYRAISFSVSFLLLVSLFLYLEPASVDAAAGLQPIRIPLVARGTTALDPVPGASRNAAPNASSVANDISSRDVEKELPRSSVPVGGGNLPTNPPAAAPIPVSNSSQQGFNGLSHYDQRMANSGNQYSLEPPDQALCVGNGVILEGVNTALVAYDSAGTRLSGVTSLNEFFKFPPAIDRSTGIAGDFTSDPKCYYDKDTNNWFFTILQLDPSPSVRAHTELAVSKSGNPLGEWKLYRIDATNDGTNGTPSHVNCPCLGDQPLIGADKNGFYITTNEFGDVAGFNGAQVYVISKQKLAQGSANYAIYFDKPPKLGTGTSDFAYSIQPSTTPPDGRFASDAGGTEYFMSSLDFTATLDNRIAVWALTNTRSLDTAEPAVKLSYKVIKSEVYGQPPDATQKDGPRPLGQSVGEPLEKLAANDDRMNQVVWADGHLWSGVNTVLASKLAGIAYFVVTPSIGDDDYNRALNSGGDNNKSDKLSAEIYRQGYVSIKNNNVIFPSIGVNPQGMAVMTFTVSGPDFYPSTGYLQLKSGGDDTWYRSGNLIHISGKGAGPEDGFTGYQAFGGNGTARWGDYSAAVAGPDGKIYLAAEYIPGGVRTVNANWGTFITTIAPGRGGD